MYFRSLAGDKRAEAWCRDNELLHKRVMNERVFTAGGALVPDMLSSEIISNTESYGVARRFARNWPMTSGTLSVPMDDGGLTVAGVAEEDATTPSDLSTSAVNLTAKEFAGGTRASRALLEDSVVALGDFLVTSFAQALAKVEDDCLFNGTGTSPYSGITGIAWRMKNVAGVAGAKIAAAAGHDTRSTRGRVRARHGVLWLRNRQPMLWRDKTRHELSGKDGAPMIVAPPDFEKLIADQETD